MDVDVEEQNLASHQPPSIFIGGPAKAENTLSGTINQNHESKNIAVWGNNDIAESSTTAPWVWFLIGLILIPLILSIISSILYAITDSGLFTEISSSNVANGDNVTIDEQTFEVYIFTMPSNFDDQYATTSSYWDLNIESYTYSNFSWWAYISGYNDVSQETVLDDSGISWYESDSHGDMQWETDSDNPNVYIRINENNVFVAVGDNFPPPTFAMYYWEGASNNTLPFLACLIWPITIIGGAIWGIRTDRKPLAYGILTWGIVAMLAVFLFTFLWFVGW